MNSELETLLDRIRKEKAFNPDTWVKSKISKLNDYMKLSNLKTCVVSVSGGIDSAVTYYLSLQAAAQPDSPIERVIGLAQPIHSTPEIQNRAYELDGPIITINQDEIFDQLAGICCSALGVAKDNQFANGQLKSYMRTPVAYYVSQLLGSALVLGTGNKDEDGYLGFFCKAGDGVCDVQLISDLHKSEVYSVGCHLNVPESILIAPPSADLWPGQTDENELGVGYDFVELYTVVMVYSDEDRRDEYLSSISEVSRQLLFKMGERVDHVHRRNKHKFGGIVNL